MPRVDWSLEQRAVVKRYTLFTGVFCVLGFVLSVFFIASGNSGGWVLLGFVMIALVCLYLIWFRRRA